MELAFTSGFLSLDRVTLLVFSPGLSLWGPEKSQDRRSENMQKVAEIIEKTVELDENFPQGFPSDLYALHFRTAETLSSDPIDIQIGPRLPVKKKISSFAYIDSFGVSDENKEESFTFSSEPSVYGIRIEYNPNKADLSVLKNFFSYFPCRSKVDLPKLLRVSRLDIAIDYPVRLRPEFILCNRHKKSFLALGTSGVETVYFGSRQSQTFFRIYDKNKELLETGKKGVTGDLWRVELESKKPFLLSEVPFEVFADTFDRLSFLRLPASADWEDQLVFSHAAQWGFDSVFGMMPSATRKRWIQRLRNPQFSETVISAPGLVCRDQLPQVFERFRSSVLSCFVERPKSFHSDYLIQGDFFGV